MGTRFQVGRVRVLSVTDRLHPRRLSAWRQFQDAISGKWESVGRRLWCREVRIGQLATSRQHDPTIVWANLNEPHRQQRRDDDWIKLATGTAGAEFDDRSALKG